MYKKEFKRAALKLSLVITACLLMAGAEVQAQGRFKKALSGSWRLINSSDDLVATSVNKDSYLHIGNKNFVAYEGLCGSYTGRINYAQSNDTKSNKNRVVYFKLKALKNTDDVISCLGLDEFEAMQNDGFYAKISRRIGIGKPATLRLKSMDRKKVDGNVLVFQKIEE